MPALTVEQNVVLPLRLAGRRVDRRRAPARCSTGSAWATGSVTRPGSCPAGSGSGSRSPARWSPIRRSSSPTSRPAPWTPRSARDVLDLLRAAVRDFGRTVVMVTHDPVAAAYADAVLFLADGRIVGRLDRPTADAVAERLAHLADSPRLVAGAA